MNIDGDRVEWLSRSMRFPRLRRRVKEHKRLRRLGDRLKRRFGR